MSQYFMFLLFTYIYFLDISCSDKNDTLESNLVKEVQCRKLLIYHWEIEKNKKINKRKNRRKNTFLGSPDSKHQI